MGRKLRAHYQPIVDAHRTELVYGQEALMRAHHGSEDQLISPSRLLSAARDAGIMPSLDKHMHSVALDHGGRVGPDTHIFINVTPRTLEDREFNLNYLLRLAREHQVSPDHITLEVIESETIQNLDHFQSVVARLKKHQFRIALDDMGAGFSNLNLLHQLRPNVVKLDMQLTRNIHSDEYKAVIAQKLLETAQGLGILTIADGIENEDELKWFREHGVDFVQGYLIGKPNPEPVTVTPVL